MRKRGGRTGDVGGERNKGMGRERKDETIREI